MKKVEIFSPQRNNRHVQYNNDSQLVQSQQGSSVASRKSNPRSLYFKKQYKLLIHKIHIFNNLSFLSLTNDVGRSTQQQSQSVYKFEKIIDVATLNAIKGTQDYKDQKVTLYLRQQNMINNSIIGILKFDMSQQKMIKIENKKSFQKQFENGGGFIEYKFISYKSQHIKADELTKQKYNKNQVIMSLKQSNDNQFESLIKAKNDIIKQLQDKISELINQSKRYKKSVSKQKQKLQLQLIKIKQKGGLSPVKRLQSPKSNILQVFSPQVRYNDFYYNPILQEDQNHVLTQHQNLVNINVKIQSSKARQKQIQTLKQTKQENQKYKIQIQKLKQQVGTLNVENKLLQQKINQIKINYNKIIQSKYNQIKTGGGGVGGDNIKKISLKQSVMLNNDNPNKLKSIKLGGFNQTGQNNNSSQQFLSVGNLEPQKAPKPPPKPRFSANQYVSGKQIDPQTINVLHKLEEQNEMLSSRLTLKEEQCQRIMKQLSNCTIQLRKKTTQFQQLKQKYQEVRSKSRAFVLDSSVDKDNSDAKQSLKLSGINQKKSIQLDGNNNPRKIQKELQQMKQSIISYESRIQDKQIQLMRSRIAEQTLQKQKALYENKYMNILQTLQTNKQKFAQAVTKQSQLAELMSQNQQLKGFTQEMMKKYEEELKLRCDCQQKSQKYKTKMKEMIEQWDRLRLIQSEHQTLKRRTLAAQKNLTKFETNYSEMKKFVLKIQASYYNITKKRKNAVKQHVSQQQLEQNLQESLNRLNELQQQYYDGMREYHQMQKKDIDTQMQRRFKLQSQKIDQKKQLKTDQKLTKKQAIEEALQSQRRSKRKKIDAKIKSLMQEKIKAQQQNQKGITLYDRIKHIEKRLRSFDQKIIEAPNYKVTVSRSSDNVSGLKGSGVLNQKLAKQLKQKIERLQQENQRLKQMGKQSMVSGGRASFIGDAKSGKASTDKNLLKNSDNVGLQMQKSQIGNQFRQNIATNQSMIKQQRKSILQEMNRNRQVFQKSFEEIKKQNSQLMKKKSQLQIEIQNYRFREQKMVMKHQQRQRQLERMFKQSNDQLMNTKDRLQAKIEKIEKQNTIMLKQNKEFQQSVTALVQQLRNVSSVLEQKQKQCIQLTDDGQLMKQRIFNYEEAQRRMLTEIDMMKSQVTECEENFNSLFEDRNSQFLKIQKVKNSQIEKLRAIIINLQDRVEQQLSQQLRLKEQIQKYQTELKRLEDTNLSLQERQSVLSQKLQNLRSHSTQQMVKLDQQNQTLRNQLMKIAQQATVLQQQLQRARLTIQSLERQVQTLEPIYNEMCQMELKHDSERQKYQDLMGGQNQKFLQLKQRYQKIVSQVKQVEDQNKQLRQRDIQFENMRVAANQKMFQRQRLVLKVQKQKNVLELQINRLSQQVDDTKQKQDHYVLQNHQLAIKVQQLQQQLQNINANDKSRYRSKFYGGDTSQIMDNQINESKVYGRGSRMLGDSQNSPFGKTQGSKSKLKCSRSNSRVLSRSRNKIEESRNFISSKQINNSQSRNMQRSKTYGMGSSRKDSNLSINPIMVQRSKQRDYNQIPSPMSPYARVMNQNLQQIEQNIDEMKATVFVNSKGTNNLKQSSNQLDKLAKLAQQNIAKSKTLEQDLNIEQVQNSSIKSSQQDNEGYDFQPEDQSQFNILIGLDKKEIIQRVHQLKQQLSSLIDENEGLKQQVKNYQRFVSNSNPNQMQYGEQYDPMNPRIEIHQEINDNMRSKNQYDRSDSSSIKQQNLNQHKGANISFASNRAQSQRAIFSKNSDGMNKFSRNNTIDKQMFQEQINKYKAQMNEKQLQIQQKSQQIADLTQQLEHQKKNTQKLLQQVQCLIADTQKVQKSLQQKNQSINNLNALLIQQKQIFDDKLERILAESLQKDKIVSQIALRCDKLQRLKEQFLRDKMKLEQKYSRYVKQYEKIKKRQKSSQMSYKQYEEQSQLQILSLKQQIDRLCNDLICKNNQLCQLAERYVDLQNKSENLKIVVMKKGSENMNQKQKFNIMLDKYKQLNQKLQKSQKLRRQGVVERQKLQGQISRNQELISQLHKKSSMLQKKYRINLSTQQQQSGQLKSKNEQLQSHVIQLKHQLALLNQQLLTMKKQNQVQGLDFIRVEKQLKDIMNSYESEFHLVQGKKHNALQQLKQNNNLMHEKQKDLQQTRRQKRSLQGQMYKLRNEMFELQQQFENYKRKTQLIIKQTNEKYEFKNNDYEILKQKMDKQCDTTTQTVGKLSTKQKKYQSKIQELKKVLKDKDRQIEQVNKKVRQKQVEAVNKVQGIEYRQRLLSNRINELQFELGNVRNELIQKKRQITIIQKSNSNNEKSVISSLNNELQQYSGRVQQLQRQNYYLKRFGEKYNKNIQQMRNKYINKQMRLGQKIYELQQQVQFYKAKRIDELNMLLNQTDQY